MRLVGRDGSVSEKRDRKENPEENSFGTVYLSPQIQLRTTVVKTSPASSVLISTAFTKST